MPVTANQAYKLAAKTLQTAGIDTYLLDAKILLNLATGISKEDLVKTPDKEINPESYVKFQQLVEERRLRKPISQITSSKEFFGLGFFVNNEVLTPRPETEIIIEQMLDKTSAQQKFNMLELGVGSGAISVTVAKNRPKSSIIATDISKNALAVCRKNMYKLGVGANIELLQSSWWEELNNLQKLSSSGNSSKAGQEDDFIFDYIVSNPPYIALKDYKNLDKELFFEPKLALTDDLDGLESYKKIAEYAYKYCHKNSVILLEIGENQEDQIEEIFSHQNIKLQNKYKDLAGIIRTLELIPK